MTDDVVIKAVMKNAMMREALASCQLEGIGKDLTIADLYLEEALERNRKIREERKRLKRMSV